MSSQTELQSFSKFEIRFQPFCQQTYKTFLADNEVKFSPLTSYQKLTHMCRKSAQRTIFDTPQVFILYFPLGGLVQCQDVGLRIVGSMVRIQQGTVLLYPPFALLNRIFVQFEYFYVRRPYLSKTFGIFFMSIGFVNVEFEGSKVAYFVIKLHLD